MGFIIAFRFVFMIPIWIYLYLFIKRSAGFYRADTRRLQVRLLCAAAAGAAAFLCTNVFSTAALVVLHICAIGLLLDLINLVVRAAGRRRGRAVTEAGMPQAQDGKRRSPGAGVWGRLYGCGLIPLLVTALILVYGYMHMGRVYQKDYTVETSKEIRSGGYRLVFLSDLHFGTTMDAEKLEEQCNIISAQDPSLVVLCGDIVDEGTTAEEMAGAFEILGGIDTEYGVYYVYGNHDRASYHRADFDAEALEKAIQRSGITILQDSITSINGELTLAGREDRGFGGENGRAPVSGLLEGADRDTFIILADHQPVELEQNSSAGVDLQISGHTHGGQIFPVGLISDVLGFGELNYGRRTVGDMEAIVSSGIAGWGYPVRTGSDSEFVVVDIIPE